MCHFAGMSTSLAHIPALLALSSLVLLTGGCTAPLAPEAQCFAAATVEYRTAWRGAQAIRADLDRGYALHPSEVRQAEAVPCRIGGARASCLANTSRTHEIPVAIDRADLERRLAALEAEMDRLRPAAMARAAPCGFDDLLAAGAPVRQP